jgi:RNA polymerase sigma-70 factor (ECF subfamily)
VEVNSRPALVVRVDGRLDSVYVLSIEEETIGALRIVRNPDKLTYIDRQLGQRSLM